MTCSFSIVRVDMAFLKKADKEFANTVKTDSKADD
jgi:hypothetical protein